MIDKNLYISKNEDGVESINVSELEKLIDTRKAKEEELKNFTTEVNEFVLNLMTTYNVQNFKSSKYTVSKVVPQDKVEFNEEKFLLEVQPEVLVDFVDIEEFKMFDEETFKKENPELYEKYIKVNQTTIVNTKKLAKANPTLFNKYSTTTKSDKPATLRITGVK